MKSFNDSCLLQKDQSFMTQLNTWNSFQYNLLVWWEVHLQIFHADLIDLQEE